MEKLEKDIEHALRRMVMEHKGLCLKWVCPGWSGVPDRIVLLPGAQVIFVELKRPKGGKVSRLQHWWAETLTRLGFEVWFIKDHEELRRLERKIETLATIRKWLDPGN